MNPSVVGIDLGTTFSLAAYVKDGLPLVVRDEGGNALVPSVISFHPNGTVLVGSVARERALADPEHTIFSVKRLMGRTLADLKQELKLIPHQITERDAGGGRRVLTVRIGDNEYTPEELSAMILREVRKRAGDPTRAVITVPAYFDDSQRQATRDAGRIAGLDVLRIVNEPTAAALAYGLDRQDGGTVAVYDLGGGTFDCSILQIADGVFKVLSTNGDTYLGGDDFDRALMVMAANEMGVDMDSRKDPQLLQALRDQAERVKISLSSAETAEFDLSGSPLSEAKSGGEFRRTFTRAEFESLIVPLVDRSLAKCRNALRDAELTTKQINEVVLVGGSTRIPYVRKRVGEFFGRTPHTELNPDEVVAIGAAIQADILTGGRRHMLLLDVVPLSLGIETLGGVVDKLVHRNTTVPARATTRYSTSADGQTAILINIYQGERELTKDCKLLGTFKLSGIPPMPAGLPQVDVTFLVNENGMLTVSAKEQRSGKETSVTVQAAHGLSQEEVDRLVLESVENAQTDFTTARFISLKNDAERQLQAFDKNLAERHELVPAEQWQAIQAARASLDAALAGSDLPTLVKAGEDFNRLAQPLAEAVMNSVVKETLAGKTEADLRAGRIGGLRMVKGSTVRKADHPIDPLFLDRWSPRAMSGETIPESDLMTLFEAARWAPSSFNNQPWRILYARRETANWQTFFDLLVDANKAWCGKAAALLVFVSRTTFEHNNKPSITHSFDCGAAWENLALQGCRMGLVMHGMQGFDYDRARTALKIPEGFQVEAMVAVGKPGDPMDLPDKARAMEAPNDRRPLRQTVCEGTWNL